MAEYTLRIAGSIYYASVIGLNKKIVKNKINILCLGDSWTFGVGAKKEMNYPSQLQRYLNKKDAQKRFHVINRGVGGYNSYQVFEDLLKFLKKDKPEVLVILVSANNNCNFYGFWKTDDKYDLIGKSFNKLYSTRLFKLVNPYITNLKYGKNNKYLNLDTISDKLYKDKKYDTAIEYYEKRFRADPHSLNYTDLCELYIRTDNQEKGKKYFREMTRSNPGLKGYIKMLDIMTEWKDTPKNIAIFKDWVKRDIIKIAKICKRNKIKLILMTYPNENKLDDDFEKISIDYGAGFQDNEKIFDNKISKEEQKHYFAPDGHCNDKGYGVIAEHLSELLIKEYDQDASRQ